MVIKVSRMSNYKYTGTVNNLIQFDGNSIAECFQKIFEFLRRANYEIVASSANK